MVLVLPSVHCESPLSKTENLPSKGAGGNRADYSYSAILNLAMENLSRSFVRAVTTPNTDGEAGRKMTMRKGGIIQETMDRSEVQVENIPVYRHSAEYAV